MIIDLRTCDLRKLNVGDKVITYNGEWELVDKQGDKESWKDLSTGLIWEDLEDGKYTHPEAMEKFSDKLPTKEEIETAISHDMLKILQSMRLNLWSSSVDPFYPDCAYGFSGDFGGVDYFFRFLNFSVRCVDRSQIGQ